MRFRDFRETSFTKPTKVQNQSFNSIAFASVWKPCQNAFYIQLMYMFHIFRETIFLKQWWSANITRFGNKMCLWIIRIIMIIIIMMMMIIIVIVIVIVIVVVVVVVVVIVIVIVIAIVIAIIIIRRRRIIIIIIIILIVIVILLVNRNSESNRNSNRNGNSNCNNKKKKKKKKKKKSNSTNNNNNPIRKTQTCFHACLPIRFLSSLSPFTITPSLQLIPFLICTNECLCSFQHRVMRWRHKVGAIGRHYDLLRLVYMRMLVGRENARRPCVYNVRISVCCSGAAKKYMFCKTCTNNQFSNTQK